MTQGRGDGVSWVTAFMLSYSLDAYDWQYVDDLYGNQRVRSALLFSPRARLLVFLYAYSIM